MIAKIVEDKLPELQALCRKHHVEKLWLFGSATRADFNEQSDLDFLYVLQGGLSVEEYAENFFALAFALQALFGRKIDMVSQKKLSNPYFIRELDRTKQIVYAAAA